MNKPQIQEIDTTAYDGHPGNEIIIRARNFFKIYRVGVAIYNEAGVLIEEGNAVEQRTPMV